jgi:serine/threonine protein kinase
MTTYTIVRKIASGGNATVYVAKAASLGIERLVALKKPHPHLVDEPAFVEAFRREAAVAVRLRHPNVVQVLDVVEHEGVPSLVLELVEGPALSALVRSALARPEVDTTAAAIAIVAAVSHGLHALHELSDEAGAKLGLVHRDVSPQNVLVGRDGVAKLSDFGLAKATASGDASTTEGVLKGKVGYLSPEYIRGEPVDRRSDVFAMGVVLWEVLAKKRLFRAERETDALAKILGMPIPELPLGQGKERLDAIVARALDRDPGGRYASAAELADALEGVAKELELDASPREIARVVSAVSGSVEPAPTTPASTAPPVPADDPTERELTRPEPSPTVTEVVSRPLPPGPSAEPEGNARGRSGVVALSAVAVILVASAVGLGVRALSGSGDSEAPLEAGTAKVHTDAAAPLEPKDAAPATNDAAPEIAERPLAPSAPPPRASAPHTKPGPGPSPAPHIHPTPSAGPRPNPYADAGK